MMLGARNPGRQMGENQIIPSEMRDQSVGGRQRYALLPFFRCHSLSHVRPRLLLGQHGSLLGLSNDLRCRKF